MTVWDLIWNFIQAWGLLPLIILMVLALVCIIPFKKKSVFTRLRDWFNHPVQRDIAETNHFAIRRSIIAEAYFIKSSVNDGTWSDDLFDAYKSLVSRYFNLSEKYRLKDGEVLRAIDIVNDLYSKKHEGHRLFTDAYIQELEALLHD